jgi:hypothetical protein
VELHGPCGVFLSDDSIKYQVYTIIVARMSKLWLMPHHLEILVVTGMSELLLMPHFLLKMIAKWNQHQL